MLRNPSSHIDEYVTQTQREKKKIKLLFEDYTLPAQAFVLNVKALTQQKSFLLINISHEGHLTILLTPLLQIRD
jgi:hypothetical protein